MPINRDLFGVPKSPNSGVSTLELTTASSLPGYVIFSIVRKQTGDAITYIHDGSAADKVQFNRPGVYHVSLSVAATGPGNGQMGFGIAKNNDVTLNWTSTPIAKLLSTATSLGSQPGVCSVTAFFEANDYITFPTADNSTIGTAGSYLLTVTLISPS